MNIKTDGCPIEISDRSWFKRKGKQNSCYDVLTWSLSYESFSSLSFSIFR
uniref:Uncharacterized protein n=1 Tax=Anguilla anguilla TaxID=7936 RepID=A0A0E9W5R9_ANGAN